jgi:plastocyanin
MPRLAIAATTLVFGALGLAACGGGGGGSPEASTTTTTTAAAAQTLKVSETEYKLTPAPLTIPKAGTYTIEATNDGQADHALNIEGNGLEEKRSDTISPGQSTSITVDLKAGTYRMYCPIDGHQKLGMVGKVIVGGSASDTTTDTTDSSGSSYGG